MSCCHRPLVGEHIITGTVRIRLDFVGARGARSTQHIHSRRLVSKKIFCRTVSHSTRLPVAQTTQYRYVRVAIVARWIFWMNGRCGSRIVHLPIGFPELMGAMASPSRSCNCCEKISLSQIAIVASVASTLVAASAYSCL